MVLNDGFWLGDDENPTGVRLLALAKDENALANAGLTVKPPARSSEAQVTGGEMGEIVVA